MIKEHNQVTKVRPVSGNEITHARPLAPEQGMRQATQMELDTYTFYF